MEEKMLPWLMPIHDNLEFILGNKQCCYPLTILDYRSRYLLSCGGLESTKWDFAFSFFERTFRNFGLLTAIGTDSGTLFAAPCAVFGLSRLAVWQLRLGIQIQRIKPWRAPIPAMSVHPRPAVYQPPPEPEYAYNDRAVWATRCGR